VTSELPGAELSVRVPGAALLAHGQSKSFTFKRSNSSEEAFVLRWGDGLYCFANSCPHWSVDLDFGTGDFFDVALDRIVCRNHGALFHPQTGFCEWGPCTGHSLESFSLSVEGDDVVVTLR
jgi:nitrite reductase/ring-hydroxylating ferredoxin subunit